MATATLYSKCHSYVLFEVSLPLLPLPPGDPREPLDGAELPVGLLVVLVHHEPRDDLLQLRLGRGLGTPVKYNVVIWLSNFCTFEELNSIHDRSLQYNSVEFVRTLT